MEDNQISHSNLIITFTFNALTAEIKFRRRNINIRLLQTSNSNVFLLLLLQTYIRNNKKLMNVALQTKPRAVW